METIHEVGNEQNWGQQKPKGEACCSMAAARYAETGGAEAASPAAIHGLDVAEHAVHAPLAEAVLLAGAASLRVARGHSGMLMRRCSSRLVPGCSGLLVDEHSELMTNGEGTTGLAMSPGGTRQSLLDDVAPSGMDSPCSDCPSPRARK